MAIGEQIASYVPLLITAIKYGFFTILFFGVVGGYAYYEFVYKRKRRWNARIWEQRNDTTCICNGADTIEERRIPKTQGHLYWMKYRKVAVVPVQERHTITIKGKNYVDYLRVGNDYVPLTPRFVFKEHDGEDVFRDYIPMPYDVNMQMISTDQLVDEMFKSKINWLEKYGSLIAVALIVVAIIILMHQYYGFVKDTLTPLLDKTTENIGALNRLADTFLGRNG
jgi:hypothetical protein